MYLRRRHFAQLPTLKSTPFPIRFNDIHVPIRLECVKFASHCLMNHPDLAKDLTGKSAETLQFISMEPRCDPLPPPF